MTRLTDQLYLCNLSNVKLLGHNEGMKMFCQIKNLLTAMFSQFIKFNHCYNNVFVSSMQIPSQILK